MSRQLLLMDPAIIEQCNLASGVPLSGISSHDMYSSLIHSLADNFSCNFLSEHGKLVSFGIDLLEGKDISSQLIELAQALGISNVKKLSALVTSFSALTW